MQRMSGEAVAAWSRSFWGLAMAVQLPAGMACRGCGLPVRVVECGGCREALGGCGLYVAECGCPADRLEARSVSARGVYLLYRGDDGAEWLAPACRVAAGSRPLTLSGVAEPPSVFDG